MREESESELNPAVGSVVSRSESERWLKEFKPSPELKPGNYSARSPHASTHLAPHYILSIHKSRPVVQVKEEILVMCLTEEFSAPRHPSPRC